MAKKLRAWVKITILLLVAGAGWQLYSGNQFFDFSKFSISEFSSNFIGGNKDVSELSLTLSGLEELDKGSYEAWAVFGEEKTSIGKFNADAITLGSNRDLTEANTIIITIEPEGDSNAEPSGITILSGDVSLQPKGYKATLKFAADLSSAVGSYILATPTNGDDSDETSGIWFIKTNENDTSAGLMLPELDKNWIYEGWVIYNGTPVSLGRFASAEGPDSSNYYSGSESAPAFPGEDLLENAPEGLEFPIDLTSGESQVILSVEPDLDGEDPTGHGLFSVQPVISDIPNDAKDHEFIGMRLNLKTTPFGEALIEKVNK